MVLVTKAALYPFQAAVLCCGSANMSSRWMAAVVLQKVAEGLNFDCGQYGSFAVYLQFPAVLCGCRTAANRGFNCLRVKGELTSKTQNTLLTSDVNKAISIKAKAKALIPKAKANAKDYQFVSRPGQTTLV